jgi:hypothetical protein
MGRAGIFGISDFGGENAWRERAGREGIGGMVFVDIVVDCGETLNCQEAVDCISICQRR